MPEIVTPAPDPVGMALSLFFQHGTNAPAVAATRLARARRDALTEAAEFWAAVGAVMECDNENGTMVAGWRRLVTAKACVASKLAAQLRNG
jgi:hypothetical protein